MTIWEKFGTSGRGVGVSAIARVGADVGVNSGRGVKVAGESVGVDSVIAGRQAEVRNEATIVIQIIRKKIFISGSLGKYLSRVN